MTHEQKRRELKKRFNQAEFLFVWGYSPQAGLVVMETYHGVKRLVLQIAADLEVAKVTFLKAEGNAS